MTDQPILTAITAALERQNELLADIRDRLPAPRQQPVAGDPAEVELTEPAPPPAASLAEPARPKNRPPT